MIVGEETQISTRFHHKIMLFRIQEHTKICIFNDFHDSALTTNTGNVTKTVLLQAVFEKM